MKRFGLALALALAVGCKAQLPVQPVLTCPATTGTSYAALNSTTPSTGLAYTDTHPASGNYCYIVQSVIDSGGVRQGTSPASNIAGPFTLSGSNSTALTWNAPTTGPTPTGYVMLRAAAIQTPVGAPALVNGNVGEVKPALISPESKAGVYALLSAPNLRGSVR